VAITCAESYNETVRRAVANNVTGSTDGYAQSLLPDIADISDVAESRVLNVVAFENPINGESGTNWFYLTVTLEIVFAARPMSLCCVCVGVCVCVCVSVCHVREISQNHRVAKSF